MVQLVGSSSLGLGKLIDGKNQFVHIRYSANADGSNMTAEIQANTKYIGIMTSNSETPPTNPSDYSWGRFVGTSGTSSYTWIRYSPNEDGSNMTTIADEETKYIGVAITSENSAPTDYTRYSWALFKGNDGRGVEKTEVSYQKSTSGTVIPTGSWGTTIPSLDDGEYLWTKTLFTYTDDTTTSTFSVSRNGMAGLGISGTDVHYQKSTSGTTAPIGTWTATIPNVGSNEYLWTRTTISYTDGSTKVSYSVGKMGADGRDAQLLYLTASSQIQAFDKDNHPKTTQAITISAKLQNASGTATFTAVPYIGNTAQTPITLGGTGNDRTLLPSQWTNTQWTIIAITATLGSLTDTISINKVKDGDTGPRGSDGIAGKDGVGIANTSITYAQSTSGTTAPAIGWAAQVPTLIKGQYLWTKTTWTYTDESTETGFTVSYNAKDGNNGVDGIAGKDGVGIANTSIQYAGSTSGTTQPTSGWSNQIPSVPGGQYLWTKTTWTYTDGTSETGYSVAKMGERGPQGLQGIQGPKGDQGIPGTNGVDGRTSYTHIAYADSADGTVNFSVSDSNRSYIGVYVDFNATDSTNPSSYQWSLIKGADGADGLPGRPGADGRTPYFHTAYANSADGSSGFSTTDSNGKLYLGTCTDYNQSDPTDYHAYTWVKIKGEQGPQGATGPAGQNGKGVKSYAITYQAGTSGTTAPTGTWSTSIPSVPQGQYLWTKMVITYTDNTSSTSYSVSYIPNNGATGNGVSSIITEFYLSTSKTTQSGGSWGTTQPTWSPGKYVWTRNKITYTNGSIAYTSPQCSSEWEAINDLQIGGRNLALNSGREVMNKDYRLSAYYISPSEGALLPNGYGYLVDGKKYTIIVCLTTDSTVDRIGVFLSGGYQRIGSINLEKNKKQVASLDFIARYSSGRYPSDNPEYAKIELYRYPNPTSISGAEYVTIYWVKIVDASGVVVKDWSPAPEDTQNQIDQANENISNKVDQGAYETDQATIWGSINSKMDDAEFRAYKAVMDNLKSSYEAFVGEGGRFEQELQNATAREQAIIQELGAKVNQLNFINTYIRESEEGIVIGAKNNPMQMLLSKDSLSFMDGGQTVAYFSNQSFYINRGAVVESLQVGVHKLTKIDNYHTVIQYIPN